MDATLIGTVVSLVITTLINALILWIVGKLNLGISVNSFGTAIIAATLIGILTAVVGFVLGLILVGLGMSLGTVLVPALVSLIVAVVVLLASGKILPGLKVAGFGGALIAAVAIAFFTWLVALIIAGLS